MKIEKGKKGRKRKEGEDCSVFRGHAAEGRGTVRQWLGELAFGRYPLATL